MRRAAGRRWQPVGSESSSAAAPPPPVDMEVDSCGTLKRCSSAPLIVETVQRGNGVGGAAGAGAASDDRAASLPGPARPRRFSASFSPLLAQPHSPVGSGPRLTPRVSQLRQEECADVSNIREVAHEREIHSAMQMSQSWEDLTLMTGTNGSGGPTSPTRARFSPGVSPSPTRKAFATRRSLSPIAMRPSCLSPIGRPSGLIPVKRRFELDDGPNAKRYRRTTDCSTPGTPDSPSGFTFRPVSPKAASLSTSVQTQTPQSSS